MQRGAVLYRDIWDNKPPLLYLIYALHPTLLWAKISATIFVLGTVFLTYKIAKNHLAALLVGILLSLPLLEGTIANAELYFVLPIALAALILLTKIQSLITPFIIGILFTVALLLKIPAIFDFLGLFLAYLLTHRKVKPLVLISLIPLISFIFLIGYFFSQGALSDFLTASFSQNASYVAIGSGPFSKLNNPLFLKAILLFLVICLISVIYYLRRVSKEFVFLSFWFAFSLYGALLSNRPYMHYLLQIVPPAVILFFYLLSNIRKYLYIALIFFSLTLFGLIRMFTGAFALDTRSYYANWFDYVSERKLWTDYANYFDSRTSNNYDLTKFIVYNSQFNEPLFVWGDNAFVFALSNRPPATKFIQAHHLTTIDPANYNALMNQLIKVRPKFIIISRPVHFAFPALEEFVAKNYRPASVFLDLHVYQLSTK